MIKVMCEFVGGPIDGHIGQYEPAPEYEFHPFGHARPASVYKRTRIGKKHESDPIYYHYIWPPGSHPVVSESDSLAQE